MIARDKFKIGQQVKLSSCGLIAFRHTISKVPYDEKLRGWVTGFSRTASGVIIEREGVATPEGFHMDYWEPIDNAAIS